MVLDCHELSDIYMSLVLTVRLLGKKDLEPLLCKVADELKRRCGEGVGSDPTEGLVGRVKRLERVLGELRGEVSRLWEEVERIEMELNIIKGRVGT